MNEKLQKEIKRALKYYPLLTIIINGNRIIVEGVINLVHPDFGEFDSYSIHIRFPHSYPHRFPHVFETSNKIHRIADRHVQSDGSLCLAVLPEELKIVKNGISFRWFLDKVLVPHLARETFYNIEKKYPSGEYSHGVEGIWEYYEDVYGTKDRQSIMVELQRIVNLNMPNRNGSCYCGSGLKFKKCHLEKWNIVESIGLENLNQINKILQ